MASRDVPFVSLPPLSVREISLRVLYEACSLHLPAPGNKSRRRFSPPSNDPIKPRELLFSRPVSTSRGLNIFYSLYPAPRFLYRSSHRRILHGRILLPRSRNESLFPFPSLLSCSLKKCSKIFFNRTTRRAEDDSIDGDCSNFERV